MLKVNGKGISVAEETQILAARLAAAETTYKDLHKAFIDMSAEMAQIKNDVTNLNDGLAELIQKLTKAGYVK